MLHFFNDCSHQAIGTCQSNSVQSEPHSLILPSLVHILATEDLTLLQQHHVTPLGLIDGIHITARLNTEPSTLAMRRGPIDLRDIDVLASIELEGRFSAVHLEMEAGVGVAELRQLAQVTAARVERDLGWVGLHDEDVVDVRLGCVQHEGLGHFAGKFVDRALRDAGRVEGQVVGGG